MIDPTSLSLRTLPFPAKLVINAFLIAVGLGYFSAMVQLHLQHGSRDGEPLPTVDDVVERFSGLKKFDGKKQPSKLELILSGPKDGGFDKNNMTRAFFDKASDYAKDVKERGAAVVDAERDLERQLLIAWGNLEPTVRQKSYDENAFAIPTQLLGKPVTEDMVDESKKNLKVKDVIEVRCAFCHNEGDKKPALDNWENIAELAKVPELKVIDGKWIKSSKQTSIEGLTQSTHAHALSFAMLFTLTGLVFAFSTYPLWFRCILAPIVLVAQFADLACWWLARVEGIGPYFAMSILGTGAVVGLGLAFQILLGSFNLYGLKGKAVLLLVYAGFSVGLGVLVQKAIVPALEAEKQTVKVAKEDKKEPAAQPAEGKKQEPKKDESKKEEPKKEEPKKEEPKKPDNLPIPESKD